jgi:hypothetical protein
MGAWGASDSWVLMGLAETPLPLVRVIGAMDALNHAIPTHEELDGGLRRLMAAGLATVEGDRPVLTAAGAEFVTRAAGGTKVWTTAWRRVEAALAGLPLPQTMPDWRLDGATYQEALSGYAGSA